MLQIKTMVVAASNGSRKAVVGSGTTSMSLSWISWKPRIEDPSKPMPSVKASASTALGGTEKCCQTPGKSVNRTSIIWTLLSLTALRTSSAVTQLRNMASVPSNSGSRMLSGTADQPLRSCFSPAAKARQHYGSSVTGTVTPACQQTSHPSAATSAFVRSAHRLQGRFDVPPSIGLFACALLFEGTGFLRGLGNGFVTVCFQELPGIVVDVDFFHSHGAISTPFSATGIAQSRTRNIGVDT